MDRRAYAIRLFVLLVLFSFSLFAQTTLCDGKIQGKLNVLNGYAAECVMHTFYTRSGWERIESEVGRNGIDGLYYKKRDGVIREVLVAESKWNTARLGRSGKGKLLKQMSKAWVLKTMQRVDKHRPMPAHASIQKLVEHDQYRARLFRLHPVGAHYIQITTYKIKNKGHHAFETFKEHHLKPIRLNEPQNRFEAMVLDAYDRCRREGLERYFPTLQEGAIDRLLEKNYLKRADLKKVL